MPRDLADLMTTIATDACQRATPEPCSLYAGRAANERAMGYAPDSKSVAAQRWILTALYPKDPR